MNVNYSFFSKEFLEALESLISGPYSFPQDKQEKRKMVLDRSSQIPRRDPQGISVHNFHNLMTLVQGVVLSEKVVVPLIGDRFSLASGGYFVPTEGALTAVLSENGALAWKDDLDDDLKSYARQNVIKGAIGPNWSNEAIITNTEEITKMILAHGCNWLPALRGGKVDSYIYDIIEQARTFMQLAASKGFNALPDFAWLPWCAPFFTRNNPINIYDKLVEYDRALTEEYLRLRSPKSTYIPPLLTILLSRCNERGDIPDELIKLRVEFSDLRNEITKYETSLHEAASRADFVEIQHTFAAQWDVIMRDISIRKTSIVYSLWDLLKGGSLWSIVASIVDKLIDQDKKRTLLGKMNRIVDIYHLSRDAGEYDNLLRRVFGGDMDSQQVGVYQRLGDAIEKSEKPDREVESL